MRIPRYQFSPSHPGRADALRLEGNGLSFARCIPLETEGRRGHKGQIMQGEHGIGVVARDWNRAIPGLKHRRKCTFRDFAVQAQLSAGCAERDNTKE